MENGGQEYEYSQDEAALDDDAPEPFADDDLYEADPLDYEPEETKCPRCGSTNWRCYDERSIYFYDPKDQANFFDKGDVYSIPIGFMVCNDCDCDFRAGVPDDLELVDDRDLR